MSPRPLSPITTPAVLSRFPCLPVTWQLFLELSVTILVLSFSVLHPWLCFNTLWRLCFDFHPTLSRCISWQSPSSLRLHSLQGQNPLTCSHSVFSTFLFERYRVSGWAIWGEKKNTRNSLHIIWISWPVIHLNNNSILEFEVKGSDPIHLLNNLCLGKHNTRTTSWNTALYLQHSDATPACFRIQKESICEHWGAVQCRFYAPRMRDGGEGCVWLRQRVWADMGVLTRRNPSFSPSSLTSNPLFFLSLSHCIWICDATKGNGCRTLSSVGSSDR